MADFEDIKQRFLFLGSDFVKELKERSHFQSFEEKEWFICEGQNVKFIPFVLRGLLKVSTMNDDKELLYYYIKPMQSCIMTFSTIFTNGKSKVFISAEEDTDTLLIPINFISNSIIKYPQINHVFYREYEARYFEMMEMINKVVFHRLDRRIMDHLQSKIEISGKNPIKISHKEIANNLGTAREVVSRILKKFEQEGNIKQSNFGIEVLVPL